MAAAVGLLLLLLGVSQGLAAPCDGRNDGAQCHVTLGETVFLQLVENASGIFRIQLTQRQSMVLTWRINGTVINTIQDRSVFIPSNGTFRINDLRQNDSVRNQVSNSSKGMNLTGCGAERSCDGRQNGTQCYGALGGAVDLQLVDNVSEIFKIHWTKNNSVILSWRNNSIVSTTDKSRFLFSPSNGTVQINDLKRTDSGEYELEIFDKNGASKEQRTLQLIVQAPVSSVQLVHECLSQGQMKVSCLSEADSPHYTWSLDGHTLTDSELFSRNDETNIIVLRQNIPGHLVCSVRNQVSNSSKGMNLIGCGFIFINCTSNGTEIAKWVHKENNTLCVEPTTVTVPPTVPNTSVEPLIVVAGVLAALVIVLVAGIAVIYAHKKKKNTKVEEEDGQEMTYADVRIVKKQGRKVEKNAEADVEYGQVKFSKKPRPAQSNPTVDDTVYAQVRKGR
ncbi:uncharacterized protein FYW61_008533 [Anableps anableps]